MPKKTITDYVFYKIVCDDCPDYIYIGSTSNFRDRKSGHKRSCNNPNEKNHNIKLYQVIREYGGWTNWNMVVIDKAEQLTLTDSRIKEEQLRKKYNGNLNMCRAFRSDEEKKEYFKEFYEQNKDKILEQKKEFYEQNKDSILEHKKEYREQNKDKITKQQKKHYEQNKDKILEKQKEHYEQNKDKILEKQKERYEQNKDEILEQNKKYKEKNKEKISEKRKEKITCICGCEISRPNLSRHLKNDKHINLMKLQNQEN